MTKRSAVAKTEIHLPQVDKILRQPELEDLARTVKREIITAAVRQELARLRVNALSGGSASGDTGAKQSGQNEKNGAAADVLTASAEAVAQAVRKQIEALLKGGIKRENNGTGVILSTNLGRAPLSAFVVERMAKAL